MSSKTIAIISLIVNIVLIVVISLIPDPAKETVSATGFTYTKFEKVECGQSYRDVIDKLGTPLRVHIPANPSKEISCGQEIGCYARLFSDLPQGVAAVTFVYQEGITSNSSHFIADVTFGRDGFLKNTRRDSWFD